MRLLHPLLLFIIATNAAPAVVTEFITETAREIPESRVVLHVQTQAPSTNTNNHNNNNHNDHNHLKQNKEQAPVQKPTAPKKDKDGGKEKAKEKQKEKEKEKGKEKEKVKEKPKEEKYFHEPGWDVESGHYDVRFFRGKVAYEEHRPALRNLVRSYLGTFKALGVETWLAHGSLLGWWWNGKVMPWDYDLDVQVSTATLEFLGDRYNGSLHEYEYEAEDDEVVLDITGSESGDEEGNSSSGDKVRRDNGNSDQSGDGGGNGIDGTNRGNSSGSGSGDTGAQDTEAAMTTTIRRTYLLDVNPHHAALAKGNGANVIDARWIDTSNGLFIDITGLRERDPEKSPGVWSCKNNHRYRTTELWPLRRTDFEGAEAWIPYAFDKILIDEYGPKSLVTEEWAGHRWMPNLREWVKVPKKQKPMSPSKEEEHESTDGGGTENVIVYEEVIVEV
ncbi:LicD family-domain-containing protein [Nemania sp. FL0031]|nr:LicD family-domain-containing protein [Nemania sp. FL0031]